MRQIIFWLLLCCFTRVYAQPCNYTLKAQIRDEDNSEALEFAYIQLTPGNYITQSDDKGNFVFGGLCAGSYTMRVSHVGCKDTSITITLKGSLQKRFRLPHSQNLLGDVDVVTKHLDAKQTQNIQVLDRQALDKTMGLALGEQLKQLNGVTSINTGPTISKPMLNGMQGYRILLLNNGVRQEGQQWGFEHAPEIDPFSAGKITVLRGAAGVRYGSDAIGGVVLVDHGDLPESAGIKSEIQFSGFSNGRGAAGSALVEGRFTKMPFLSWRLQGSAKQSGSIKTPNYFLKNTASEERNYSAVLDYHRPNGGFTLYYSHFGSKLGIFTGSHIGNLSDLYAAFASSKPQDSLADFSYAIGRPYQLISHDLVKTDFDIHTGKRSRLKFTYAWQLNHRQEYDKNLPRNQTLAALNLPEADYRLQTNSAEIIWEHEYIRAFRGQFGVQAIQQQNRYQQKYFIPNYNAESAGLFALERYVKNNLEIELGVRADYKTVKSYYYSNTTLQTPRRSFSNISIQAGSNYKLNNQQRLSVTIGNGWRAPSPVELYANGLHHGVAAIERGDSSLNKEACVNGILSYNAKWQVLSLELAVYHYRFSNFIYYYPSDKPELTIRGAFPVFYYAQSPAAISGGDLQLKTQTLRGFYSRIKTMLIRGTNKKSGEPLIYLPSDRIEIGIGFTKNDRNGKLVHSFYFEPVLNLVAQQTRVPANADYVAPPPAYYLLGFQAGCELHMNHQILFLSLSASNITNVVYRDYLDRQRYYNDAAAGNYQLNIRIPITIKKHQPYEDLIKQQTE